jgi:class 3 adenylate cyclase
MVRAALSRHRGHEVKTARDRFLATFDATGRALRCATEILAGAKDIGLVLRAGVHSGDVEVRGDDIAGLAVTIAKRVCDLAGPGQVLLSETVRGHLVGAGIEFADRGEHGLKGVPGTWRLFSVRRVTPGEKRANPSNSAWTPSISSRLVPLVSCNGDPKRQIERPRALSCMPASRICGRTTVA